MNKLTVGKKRSTEGQVPFISGRKEARILFATGCVAMCLTLVITFFSPRKEADKDLAIPAMSTGVATAADELEKPERDTSLEVEEWSIYDYIGQMIADLLFGD